MLSKFREPVNGLTHFFAALAAAAGTIALLIVSWGKWGKTIPLSVYGMTLILLFAASATYHLVKARPEVIAILRKLDHAAIYLSSPAPIPPSAPSCSPASGAGACWRSSGHWRSSASW